MHNPSEVLREARRIEELTRKLEASGDPATLAAARELVGALMELHGAGLEQMLEIVSRFGTAGQQVLEGFSQDPLVGNLLVLYGLHPQDLETRVRHALDKVRKRAASRGSVELRGIAEGAVRVRVRQGLKQVVEEAIYEAAPDVTSLEIEEVADGGAGFVPLEKLLGAQA
jgi:hypothetical protein